MLLLRVHTKIKVVLRRVIQNLPKNKKDNNIIVTIQSAKNIETVLTKIQALEPNSRKRVKKEFRRNKLLIQAKSIIL